MNQWLSTRWSKPIVFGVCLLPIVLLIYLASTDSLGSNPAEALLRKSGDWALRALCLVLAVTPIRKITGWSALARYRRMLGLFAYFYAMAHFLSYAIFDMGLDIVDIFQDIPKRPFILVGFSAVCLLTLLALTSFNKAIRILGSKNWQMLHRLVYLIAPLGILHFFWMRAGKNNFSEVIFYAGVVGGLLGYRLILRWRQIQRTGLSTT